MALVLALHLLGALLMAASPALHQEVHHDSDHHAHECSATLIESGAVESAAVPVECPAPLFSGWQIQVFPVPEAPQPCVPEGQLLGRAPPIFS